MVNTFSRVSPFVAVMELGITVFVAKIGINNVPSLKLFQEKLGFKQVRLLLYVHVYVCIYVYMCVWMCVCSVYVGTCVCMCVHMCACVSCVHMCVCMCVYIMYACVCMCVWMCVCICVPYLYNVPDINESRVPGGDL